MNRLMILLQLLLGGAYGGPIPGSVDSPPKFLFSHTSDWKNAQIVNTIENRHRTESLVVMWPESGIVRPEANPLPPNQPDSRKTGCPETNLGKNLTAQLYYGLSSTPKTAGVYKIQTTPKTEPKLISEINSSMMGKPYRLTVTSTVTPDRQVEYRFSQEGGLFQFSFPLPQILATAFTRADWRVTPRAADTLKFGNLPLRERIPNFNSYSIVRPINTDEVVRIPAASYRIESVLLFVVGQDMTLLNSGLVSMHIPQ